ncbi:Tip attachment protein J [uncultured Caudovirales phage]|uniref:Tip attachment protein J n=1 Tax=uncultured Caudovirales phage TaxID=2100421 RepID=A0A6J7X193_9CAUD|nr:Tip attachment protein J [uncultured Caudovirales phage]
MSKVFKAVGNAVSSVVKAVVNVVSSVVKAVVNVVASVVNFVAQPFMGLLGGMPDIPSAQAEAARQQGVLLQREGSDQQIPVVYGYRKVGGIVTFAETGSDNNKYLYVIYVFAEGTVEGLREVYIDDWQLPVNLTANLNAGQLVTVNTDRYKDRVTMIWNPGVYYANPASSPVGSYLKNNLFGPAPSFTSSMNFNGLAALAVRYEWREIKTQADADNNPFTGNIPQVQVAMLGKRIAPINSQSSGFAYDSAPVRYSTNPAECLLDYLRNPRYGKGLENTDIDWDSWIKTTNKCNTIVNYVTGQSYAGPILTCNFVLDTSQTILANTKTLLMGFRAYMPYVQGKYKLRIEDAGNELDILSGVAQVVMTATTKPYPKNQFTGNVADIVGDITYTGIDKSNKYTSVVVNYVDPDQKWSPQQVVWPETEQERQTYIVKDGGRENKQEATFPTITNYAIAKDMAKLLFLKSRRQETLSITVTGEGMELEPGDNIRVEGNILNFNTGSLIVPWRVVSVKLNDNMTVTLGLVKNPDDIYPHARYNEEDLVDPVYVPKGSDIYYPSSVNRTAPVGLVPPNAAPFPPVVPPNLPPSVPPPPFQPVIPYVPPGGTPVNPSDPANPTPVPVEPPKPFTAFLTLKSSRATLITGNTYTYSLVFTQPNDGLYSYSLFYWRLNRFSAWQEIRLATIPGVGGDIPCSFVCTFGQFDFYVRSYATDGRASNRVVQGTVVLRQNSAELNPNLTGVAQIVQVQTVSDGWTVPASEIDPNPRYNDIISDFAIIPQTSGGLPLVRRKVYVRMTQLVDAINQTPNNLIKGVRIYYKNSADTYYAFEDKFFDDITGYSPYNQTEFNLNGDFGARYGGAERYDFVAKLLYKDGGNATKYLSPGQGRVETNGFGQFSGFIIYGTNPYANANARYLDIPAGWTIQTVDQAPQGPKAGSEIVPSIKRILPLSNTQNRIGWEFEKPQSTKFMGFKIRFREVVPGTDPGFTTLEVDATIRELSQDIYKEQIDGGFRLNSFYDWVVTAQYWDPITANTLESDNSLVCRASVPVSAGLTYTNLMNTVFNFTVQNTKAALDALDAPFAATPTPGLRTWIKRQAKVYDVYGLLSAGGTQIVGASPNQVEAYALKTSNVVTAIKLGSYYKLTFTTPNDTFDNITVYRRVYDQAAAAGNQTSVAKYYGLGAWEKVEIPRTSMTKAGGVYTVNLRGPLHPELFEGYYQLQAGKTLYSSAYTPSGNWPIIGGLVVNSVYPYWGAGNTNFNITTNTKWVEFLIAIKDVGVLSDKAARLTDFNTSGLSASYRYDTDGFISGNVSKLNVVSLSDYNNFVAGYGRNLNEAITGVSLDKLVLPGGTAGGHYGFSGTPYRFNYTTPAVNWIYLTGPESGDTVF